MENNQFNPQQPTPQPAPQATPFTQQPQQQAPQQQAPFTQQPQQFQQPQQHSQFTQQPMQQQFQQPVVPKQPMTMEKRTFFIAMGLIATYLLAYATSTHLSLYFKDDLMTNFTSIFSMVFSTANMTFKYIILFLAIMTFVPEWSKKFFSYINARLVLVTVSISTIALSSVSFIALIITTVMRNNAFTTYANDLARKYNTSGSSFIPRSTPNFFTLDFILIPALIATAVFVLIMALPLPKNKLRKDRYTTALLITAGTLLVVGFIMFILTLFSNSSYTY